MLCVEGCVVCCVLKVALCVEGCVVCLGLRCVLCVEGCVVCCSSKQERVDQGIETEGSNLSGVSAKCVWDDLSRPPEDEEDTRSICIGAQPRRLSDKGRTAAESRSRAGYDGAAAGV